MVEPSSQVNGHTTNLFSDKAKSHPGGWRRKQVISIATIPDQDVFERAYIQRFKLALFPVKERDKVPMTLNGFKDATTDLEVYRSLYGARPHNIGVPTGPANGFFVLDIDPRHGGNETFKHLLAQYGSMPPTWQSKTQSGGTHYFFAWDVHRPVGNKASILPGIDIRGDGGYVLLPPSLVEGTYEWVRSPSKYELLPAPEWLYSLLDVSNDTDHRDLSYLADGVGAGSRNVSITELSGMLLGRGVPVKLSWALVEAFNQIHCDPPLDEQELLKTFTSIANREIAKRQRRQRRIGA